MGGDAGGPYQITEQDRQMPAFTFDAVSIEWRSDSR